MSSLLLVVLLLFLIAYGQSQIYYKYYVDPIGSYFILESPVNCSSGTVRRCSSIQQALDAMAAVTVNINSTRDEGHIVIAPGNYMGCFTYRANTESLLNLLIYSPLQNSTHITCLGKFYTIGVFELYMNDKSNVKITNLSMFSNATGVKLSSAIQRYFPYYRVGLSVEFSSFIGLAQVFYSPTYTFQFDWWLIINFTLFMNSFSNWVCISCYYVDEIAMVIKNSTFSNIFFILSVGSQGSLLIANCYFNNIDYLISSNSANFEMHHSRVQNAYSHSFYLFYLSDWSGKPSRYIVFNNVSILNYSDTNVFYLYHVRLNISNCEFSGFNDSVFFSYNQPTIINFISSKFTRNFRCEFIPNLDSIYDYINLNILLDNCSFVSNWDLSFNVISGTSFFIRSSLFYEISNAMKSLFLVYNDALYIENCQFISVEHTSGSIIELFYKHTRNSTFNGLYFLDVRSPNSGASFHLHENSFLRLSNSTLINCITDGSGCIFAAAEAKIWIINSSFANCISTMSSGGCLYLSFNSALFLVKSSFKNSSSQLNGGTIFAEEFSNLHIFSTFFIECFASLNGGCIYVSSNSFMEIYDVYSKITVSNRGGFIFLQSKSNITVQNSLLSQSTAYENGGLIYLMENTNITILESRMSKNMAKKGSCLFASSQSYLNINRSAFEFNIAGESGGVIYADQACLNVQFSNFSSNSANLGGSIFANQLYELKILFSVFFNNSAIWNPVYSKELCSLLSGTGGAIFSNESISLNISMNRFTHNYADWFGGAFSLFEISNNVGASMLSNIFTINRAKYGPSIGSLMTSILAWSSVVNIYQGETIVIFLTLKDIWNQSVSLLPCSLKIVFDSQKNEIFKLSNTEFSFKDLSITNQTGFEIVYEIPVQFVYKNVLLEFPNVSQSLHYSLWVVVEQVNVRLESNRVNFSINFCPRGNTLVADAVAIYKCVPCRAGAFLNSSGIEPAYCSKCIAGFYSLSLSTFCKTCNEGRFSAEEGQADSCPLCPLGTFSPSISQTACLPCAIGRFNSINGQSYCMFCSNFSTTLQIRSNKMRDCVCPPGFYGDPLYDVCKICPLYRGLKCDANSTIPFVDSGFWRSYYDPSLVFQCVPSHSCLKSSFSSSTPCALGYEGIRCGACSFNRYRVNEDCEDCLQSWISILVVTIGIIVVFFVYMQILFVDKHSSNRTPISLIITPIQKLGVLIRFSEVQTLSLSLRNALSIIDISNGNLGFVLANDCFFRLSFWSLFALKIFFPFLLFIFMSIVGYFVTVKLSDDRKNYLSTAFQRSISAFWVFLTSLYIFVLNNILTVFRCYPQDDGSYTLLSFPSLDCYDDQWIDNLPTITFGILFMFLLPLILFFILYRNRKNLVSTNMFWLFHRLILPYKPQYYYWEIVVLIRKTVFVCLVDLTNGWSKSTRAFLLEVFMSVELYVDGHVRPQQNTRIPVFEIQTM